MLKDGAFVVDAGITFDKDGKMCGDCDKALYDDEDILVTTVPGGVGLMTRLSLMENVIEGE
jgi:methylenetetrahydrofolate dehydrogenase (NADP+)/methenyltetrahydrofolate cyclohydrolase